MAFASARTAHVAQAWRAASLAPTWAVSTAVSPVTIPIPSRAAATMASTIDCPPWVLLLRLALFDRTDEPVHRRDHRDRDEADDEADDDHERRLQDGDHSLEPVVHLF